VGVEKRLTEGIFFTFIEKLYCQPNFLNWAIMFLGRNNLYPFLSRRRGR